MAPPGLPEASQSRNLAKVKIPIWASPETLCPAGLWAPGGPLGAKWGPGPPGPPWGGGGAIVPHGALCPVAPMGPLLAPY